MMFQRKKVYYNVSWNNAVTNEKETRYDSVENGSESAYNFIKGILIESYNNKPDITNIKNDYTIWGQKSTKDASYPIHIRCAIDDKPIYYKPLIYNEEHPGQNYIFGNKDLIYTRKIQGSDGSFYQQAFVLDEENQEIAINYACDWREIIYQMAVDYAQSDTRITALHELIANGTADEQIQTNKELLAAWEKTWNTKYVAYYTDLLGFWRQLYNFDKEEWRSNQGWNPDYVQSRKNEETGTEYIELVNHDSIIFWFDFLDDAYLEKYKPSNIGRRTKVINDNDVKAIFFEETPNLLFIDPNELHQAQERLSYVRLNLTDSMSNYFRISTQGKSAKEVLDNLLYQHTYFCESITISCVPIYYLQPNTRISVYDEDADIHGEYIIKSYNLQLNQGGSMSITATKAEQLIL